MQVNVEQFAETVRYYVDRGQKTYNPTVTFDTKAYSFVSAWQVTAHEILSRFPHGVQYVLIREQTKKMWPHWHGHIIFPPGHPMTEVAMNRTISYPFSHTRTLTKLRKDFGRTTLPENFSLAQAARLREVLKMPPITGEQNDFTSYIMKELEDNLSKDMGEYPIAIAQNICSHFPGFDKDDYEESRSYYQKIDESLFLRIK